jgi:hypothetical protein
MDGPSCGQPDVGVRRTHDGGRWRRHNSFVIHFHTPLSTSTSRGSTRCVERVIDRGIQRDKRRRDGPNERRHVVAPRVVADVSDAVAGSRKTCDATRLWNGGKKGF